MSHHLVVRIFKDVGQPDATAELDFADRDSSNRWINLIMENPTALGEGLKKDDFKKVNDNFLILRKTDLKSLAALPSNEKFKAASETYGISRTFSDASAAGAGDAGAAAGGDAAAGSDDPIAALSAKLDKLAEQLEAVKAGQPDLPGKELGKNWAEGPNWIGGHESYKLVDQAYKTCLKKKDEGDDRGFSMMFSQEMMELRRRQRG